MRYGVSFYYILDKKIPTPTEGELRFLWVTAVSRHRMTLASRSGVSSLRCSPSQVPEGSHRCVHGASPSLAQWWAALTSSTGPALLTPHWVLVPGGNGQSPPTTAGQSHSSQPSGLVQLGCCPWMWALCLLPALGLAWRHI